MWVIRRVTDRFVIVAAYRKRDLPTLEEVRKTSGFVAPYDALEIVNEEKEAN